MSPDGRRIAFTARVGDAGGIWVRDLEDASARLVPDSGDAPDNFRINGGRVAWSPDSRRLAFCAREKVKKVGLDGQPPEVLDVPCLNELSWSPRGEFLLERADGLARVGETGGAITMVTSLPGEAYRQGILAGSTTDGASSTPCSAPIQPSPASMSPTPTAPAGGGCWPTSR